MPVDSGKSKTQREASASPPVEIDSRLMPHPKAMDGLSCRLRAAESLSERRRILREAVS